MAGPVTRFGFSTVLGIQGPAGPPGPIGPAGSGLPPLLVPQLSNRVASGAEDAVLASGRALINDHGGGQFVWDPLSTATADGIMAVAVSGVPTGRWVRQFNGEYEAEWFGCKGDSVTDDTVALQLAIDSVPDFAVLKLRPGATYKTTDTINIGHSMTLQGPKTLNQANTTPGAKIQMVFPLTGPVLDIGGRGPIPEALTQVGNFNCIALSGTSPRAIAVLSETDVGAMDGLTALTVEFFMNPQNSLPMGGVRYIYASRGAVADTVYSACSIWHDGTAGAIGVHLHTSGGDADFLSATTMPVNALTHVRVEYDGTHVWLYINGTKDANSRTLAPGHIIQSYYENVTVGAAYGFFPLVLEESSPKTTPTLLASFRKSSKAIDVFSTATITVPTTELTVDTSDHSTDILLNFGSANWKFNKIYLTGHSGKGRDPTNGPVNFYAAHGLGGVNTIGGVRIDGITTSGSGPTLSNTGLFMHDCLYVDVDLCVITGGDKGLSMVGGYGHSFRRTVFSAVSNQAGNGYSWAIGCYENPGGLINPFDGCIIGGGGNFSICSSAGGNFQNIFIKDPPKYTVLFAQVGIGDAQVLNCYNVVLDDESAAVTVSGVDCFGMNQVLLESCEWAGTFSSSCPMYRLGGNVAVKINDDIARLNPGMPGLIQFIQVPWAGVMGPNRVELLNPTKFTGGPEVVPLCDPAHYGDLEVPLFRRSAVIQAVTADADIHLNSATFPDNWLYGTRVITDVGVILTAGRNVVDPHPIQGIVYEAVNSTAQVLTFKGVSGSGIAIAAGKSARYRFDGTNMVRVTGDV